jgi:hypothetical protein
MILLERWVIASLLSLGLASTAGAPGQSPTGTAQQKQAAPELPPWDSAQPPPPIRPPSPDDKPLEPDPDPDPPAPSADTVKPADASQPAQVTQPAPAPPYQAEPPPRQQAAQPAPRAEEAPAPTLPPSTDPVQRQMEKDTARLLQLVRELKAEVNKAGSNTLSLAAVQKADEIQRLVKSLKEQMRERGQVVVSKP